MEHDKIEQPKIDSGSIVFCQDGDCCGGDEYQILEVSVHDGGGGKYLVIKTDRWAFSDIDELIALLKSVALKFEIENQGHTDG